MPHRIALLTYSTKPRGSVIHTLELANALHAQGHHVCVYALDKDGQGFDWPLKCDRSLILAQPASSAIDDLIQQRIQEFVQHFQQSAAEYDIYHAQDCISANALAQLKQQGRISRFVRTVHHVEDFASPYLQQCQDRSIRQPDRCLCVSDRWQTALQQDYGITAPRVINGINTQRFSAMPNGQEADLKQRYGLNGAPIYLTVGGIEPRKNSLRILEAFAKVLTALPKAQLVIAGGATLFDYQSYRNEFFQQADRLGIPIGQSLVLPGVIADADLPTLYRCADAFVFPSVKEGWGLVVLEAIASGLPVITANQTPFTEFLSADQAWLVDPQRPPAIADAMLSVHHNSGLAQTRVQNSQAILAQYTWHRSAEQHVQQYQMLLRV